MSVELHPERRSLPLGHRDESSPYFIPRPLRSYYQTVSLTPDCNAPGSVLSKHLRVLDLACDWLERDIRYRVRPPGAGA